MEFVKDRQAHDPIWKTDHVMGELRTFTRNNRKRTGLHVDQKAETLNKT